MNKIFTQKKYVEVNVKTADVIGSNSSEFNFPLGNTNSVRTSEPSQQSIQNILNYSKALSVKRSKSLDYLEVVLN